MMASDMKSMLRQNSRLLRRSLVVSDSLLFDIADVSYFNDKTRRIKQFQSQERRAEEFLDIFAQVPDSEMTAAFDSFQTALRQDNQEHVANIFSQQSDARPMSDEHYQLLIRRSKEMCKFLDPLNGVLDEFVSCGVFTKEDGCQVIQQQGIDEMARETIGILSRKADSAFDLFITALHNSGQQHVAALLRPDTSTIPMTDEHRQLMVEKKLCVYLNPLNGVLDGLVACHVFNSLDRSRVRAQGRLDEMARETIDILIRKADSAFNTFIDVLINTGQQHVATILQQDIGIPPMSEEHRRVLSENTKLCMFLDPPNGVLDELVARHVFSDSDRSQVRAQREINVMARETIDILIRKADSAFSTFIDVLNNTSQQHVATILQQDIGIPPMSEEHRRMLSENTKLCMFLDPLNGVLDELVACHVFSDRDRSQARAHRGLDEMARETIDILSRKADRAFNLFITALCNTGQQHVATMLLPDIGIQPISDEHRKMLNKKTELCKFLDPINGVLDELVCCGVFSDRDSNQVRAQLGLDEMARETIDILRRKADSAFDMFIATLHNTGQEHVVYILTGEGEPPLSEIRRTILEIQCCHLLKAIDTENSLFIDKLRESGVLNSFYAQHIAAEGVNYRKNRILLDILARKSQSAYDRFLEALKDKDIDQATIALTLEGIELKATVDPHFLSQASPAQQLKVVQLVRNRIGTLVSGRDMEVNEITDFMKQNGFIVSSVTHGSIHITFKCFNEESFINLRKLYEDKTLDRLFTQTFCPEFAADGLESLTLNISDDEFWKCHTKLQQMRLMTPTHQHALSEAGLWLSNKIIFSEDLLSKLSLTEHHKQVIRQTAGHIEQVKKLLDIISRRPDSTFTQLINSLETTGQNKINPKLMEYCQEEVRRLPADLLKTILQKTIIKLFTFHVKLHHFPSHETTSTVYAALSAVCQNWWQTLNGLPQSNTRHRLMHQLYSRLQSGGHAVQLQSVYGDLVKQLVARSVANEMFEQKTLTKSEHEAIIDSNGTETGAAQTLVNILLNSPTAVYESFLAALQHTNQQHIIQLIKSADYNDTVHCRLLRDHYVFLMEQLNTKYSALIHHLIKAEVLSLGERENIEAELTSTRQNQKLLYVLSRKSVEQFQHFLTALDKTNQRRITDKLKVLLIHRLPVELLELVLMTSFIKLFTKHFKSHYKTHEAIAAAYSALSAVCSNWLQTMNGWPQSNTRHWLRHQLQRSLQSKCDPYSVCPRLQFNLTVSRVMSVAQCDDKLFVVCAESNTIQLFSGYTKKQQTNITVKGLKDPTDIVACTETKQLYIADWLGSDCVWRLSVDSQHADKWLTVKSTANNKLDPYSLSLTSRRLVVTSLRSNSIFLFGSDGIELKHISLPDVKQLRHAVETSHETFIVCHGEPQPQVSEVDIDGKAIRVYCNRQQLSRPYYMTLDSDGRVLVADNVKHRVLLFNSHLELERVLLDLEHHKLAEHPRQLCYVEQSRQLIVASWLSNSIQLYRIR